MPRLDRSGPRGAGPMTGGRRGLCGRPNGPADMPVYGGGYGRRRGYGLGPAFGAVPYPQTRGSRYPVSKTDEMEMLQGDAEAMRNALESIQRRIAELENNESQ